MAKSGFFAVGQGKSDRLLGRGVPEAPDDELPSGHPIFSGKSSLTEVSVESR